MKRDKKLIEELLFEIETIDSTKNSKDIKIKGYDSKEIEEHLLYMYEQNLFGGIKSHSKHNTENRVQYNWLSIKLTKEGHDLLDKSILEKELELLNEALKDLYGLALLEPPDKIISIGGQKPFTEKIYLRAFKILEKEYLIENTKGQRYEITGEGIKFLKEHTKPENNRTNNNKEKPPASVKKSETGLTNKDIYKVVNRYIGVIGGYLGNFSYSTHQEFYLEYCDLDINTYDYEGTTRERFIQILSESDPRTQAIILEGILEKYSIGSDELRTQERYNEIKEMIAKCNDVALIKSPSLIITSEVVKRAIDDAEILIKSSGAISGVDRMHTALHGYLKALCDAVSIDYGKDPSITQLFKIIKQQHPNFKDLGEYHSQVSQVLKAFGSIFDVFNLVRNRGSIAHPNKNLLGHEEAKLFINAARTILHYLDAKISTKTT